MNDQIETIKRACIHTNHNIQNRWEVVDLLGENEKLATDDPVYKAKVWHNYPVRIADILASIQGTSIYAVTLELSSEQKLIIYSEFEIEEGSSHCEWNLLKDEIALQSPETIQFIYELLK